MMKSIFHLIVVCMCAVLATATFAATSAVDDSLKNKDYAAVVTNWQQVIPDAKPTFLKVAQVAIAVQKTNGWGGDTAAKLTKQLSSNSASAAWLDGLHLLLGEDTKGFTKIIEGGYPEFDNMPAVITLFNEHGFTLTANCFAALYATGGSKSLGFASSNDPKINEGMAAWGEIPLDKVGPIDEVLFTRLDKNRDLLNTVLYKSNCSAAISFRLLTHFDLFSKKIAGYGFNSPKSYTGGKKYVQAWVAADPNDGDRLLFSATLVKRTDDYPLTASLFRNAIEKLKEPEVRDARIAYADVLKKAEDNKVILPKEDQFANLLADANPLVKAEALIVQEQYSDAAKIFAATMKDTKAPLTRRLAAWGSLLDCDPPTALAEGVNLVYAVEAETKTDYLLHGRLVLWMTATLWRATGRELKNLPEPEYLLDNYSTRYSPMSKNPQNAVKAAEIMETLWTFAPMPLVRDDIEANYRRHWRYQVAVILVSGGKSKLAAQVLFQKFTEVLPAPKGGWRDPLFGRFINNDPKVMNYPDWNHAQRQAILLKTTVEKVPSLREKEIDVIGQLAIEYGELLYALQRGPEYNNLQKPYFKNLGVLNTSLVTLAESTAKPEVTGGANKVDMKIFEPINVAFRIYTAADNTSSVINTIWPMALKDAFTKAKTPELREAIFELAIRSLKKVADSRENPTGITDEARLLAWSITAITGDKENTYTKRLIELYPAAATVK